MLTGTKYPSKLVTLDASPLKDCRNNSKIGGTVRRGPHKGARLYGLTLEERASCPTSCGQWNVCYGNHMPWAWRHVDGDPLRLSIEAQLGLLCRPKRPLFVRLHVLGDFPSVDYVQWWRGLLDVFPTLHLWGYTHWPSHLGVGQEIQHLLNTHPRVRILQSIDAASGFEQISLGGYALVVQDWAETPRHWVKCPAELTDRTLQCADCMKCMSGHENVVFRKH